MGRNDYNQLGIEEVSRTCYEVPRKVEIKNIIKIYADNLQSAALSKDGIAYYWGYYRRKDIMKSIELFRKNGYKQKYNDDHCVIYKLEKKRRRRNTTRCNYN